MCDTPNPHLKLEEKFKYAHMASLDITALKQRVIELEGVLKRFLELRQKDEPQDCFKAGADQIIIRSLQQRGHELFSWGYDGGNVESWSADYIKQETDSFLYLKIYRGWHVSCDWVERDKISGHNEFLFKSNTENLE